MNRALFIIIALCALTAALVPRDRREAKENKTICAAQTPCGWSIYKPDVEIIEVNISNNYCDCKEGTVCRIVLHDKSTNALVHLCR